MNNRLKPKTCSTCGVGFLGGPTSVYCPECRAERIRQRDRSRTKRQREKARKIGSIDICELCGAEYTVNAGPQKHCPACQIVEAKRQSKEKFIRDYSNPVKRQQYIDRSRHWAINNRQRMAEILRLSYERRINEINNSRRKRTDYKLRPLGRAENCPKCGNEFTVRERNQKYCDACRS